MSNIFIPMHLIRTSYTWPMDAHSRLKELHMEGLSYTKIAQTLNEEFKGRINYLTKNSIAGKIQRLGLANKEDLLSLRYIKRKRKTPVKQTKPDTIGGVSLFEAKSFHCLWIEDGQSLCCGKKNISHKTPYCEYHAWERKDEDGKPKCVYIGFKSKSVEFKKYMGDV